MPLQDAIPLIDNRRFEQLRQEVLTRIPRYTPEWTDFNDSDPGITLAQLFAWMTELLTYRLGKVPELNYIKFLQLLGIELNAAEPATTQITFPVKDTFAGPYLIVPERTQVSAQPPAGGPPLIFETDRALIAITARLVDVRAFDGYSVGNVFVANRDATDGYAPFGPLAADGSALLLGFDSAGPFPSTELDLAVWVAPEGPKPAPVKCGLPDPPGFGPAVIVWQYFDGTDWQGIPVRKDETRAFTRTGHVYLKLPLAPVPKTQPIPSAPLLYWIRAFLKQSQYAKPPSLLTIRTNTVAATQAETLQDEVLGGSSGRPDQVFTLSNTPVVRGSLVLEIDQGEGFTAWTEVDDFLASQPHDEYFVLDRASGEVRLGDGVNGAIPVANPANPDANVVARTYRAGGGTAGNLPAGAIKTLATSVPGVDDNGVVNPFASSGGREEESLDQAKSRAPAALKSRGRAVTAEDYETLAAQAADVRRAKALPLFHPDFPGVSVPGVVTVIVVPDAVTDPAAQAANPMPMPSDGTLRTVCAFLDQRRLLTTELYVVPPAYQQVEIQGEVVVSDGADLAEVGTAIEASLLAYLHPLTGGEDGQGWPFGGAIFFSLIYQRILSVPGVQSIKSVTLLVDRQAAPACTDVAIAPNALVYSTGHDVAVHYGNS